MTFTLPNILSTSALACAALAAVVLIAYLIRRPPLTAATRLWLFLGLGPLPIAAAIAGNVANLEVTKERHFCGSCHVMEPYIEDVSNPESKRLAAVHSRNEWFGHQSCYVCHADYGMFGTVVTKIGGMHHVWDYYTGDWGDPSHRPPALYKPYSNDACRHCHAHASAREPMEHRVHKAAIENGSVGCAKEGCHGPPHPKYVARGSK